MSKRLIVIAEYRDRPQACLAQSTLEAQGIQCSIENQYIAGVNWLYSKALGNIKLKVPQCDAVWANEILCRFEPVYAEDFDNELALEATCPHCGSIEIITKNFTRKFASISLLFSLPLFVFLKRNSCKECCHKWK
jgi:hypothetical protein